MIFGPGTYRQQAKGLPWLNALMQLLARIIATWWEKLQIEAGHILIQFCQMNVSFSAGHLTTLHQAPRCEDVHMY